MAWKSVAPSSSMGAPGGILGEARGADVQVHYSFGFRTSLDDGFPIVESKTDGIAEPMRLFGKRHRREAALRVSADLLGSLCGIA